VIFIKNQIIRANGKNATTHLDKTIDEIQYLVETSNGDTGRLTHILEAIKNKRKLYQSDQNFLENKLGTSFSLEEKENPPENKILSKIQNLINLKVGDPMRLKHIYDTISKNKPLDISDQQYLENTLNSNLVKDENISFLDEKRNNPTREKIKPLEIPFKEKKVETKPVIKKSLKFNSTCYLSHIFSRLGFFPFKFDFSNSIHFLMVRNYDA
jgi:ribosome assembly protein YihI (activator of Der GTPase)